MAFSDVGLIAGAVSTSVFVASYLPMLVKAARSRDLSSYSVLNLLLANVGNGVHSIYVFSLPAGPLWALHTFYLVSSALMLFWWARFRHRRYQAAGTGDGRPGAGAGPARRGRVTPAGHPPPLRPANRLRRNGSQARTTSTAWMPASGASISAWPLPARDSARTVQLPGAVKNRKSPVGELTTSAVNSPVASSSRTNAPRTGSVPASTLPCRIAWSTVFTPAGSSADCTGAPHDIRKSFRHCGFRGAGAQAPVAIGTPTSEPYSVQEPS